MPDKSVVPRKVAVPFVAVSEPAHVRLFESEKLAAAVMLPGVLNANRFTVPPPVKFLFVPVSVRVFVVAVKLPLTVKSPEAVRELVVVMTPGTVRLEKVMPVPLMVLFVPVKVTAPTPPGAWMNVLEPTVLKLPAMFSDASASLVMPTLLMTRLLKLFRPEPIMRALVPFITNVLALPLNVPRFVQPELFVNKNELPLNVAPAPSDTPPWK